MPFVWWPVLTINLSTCLYLVGRLQDEEPRALASRACHLVERGRGFLWRPSTRPRVGGAAACPGVPHVVVVGETTSVSRFRCFCDICLSTEQAGAIPALLIVFVGREPCVRMIGKHAAHRPGY